MTRKIFLCFLITLLISGCRAIPSATPTSVPPATIPASANGYRFIYLINSDGSQSDIAPRVIETVDATVLTGWEDVAAINDPFSFDGLIIDPTVSSDTIDTQWLSAAYDTGLVIVTIDRYAPEVAELVGDPTITDEGFASEPYPGHFYVAVTHQFRGHPDIIASIQEDADAGRPRSGVITSQAGYSFSRATETLDNEYGWRTFEHVIPSKVNREYRLENYPETRYPAPTPFLAAAPVDVATGCPNMEGVTNDEVLTLEEAGSTIDLLTRQGWIAKRYVSDAAYWSLLRVEGKNPAATIEILSIIPMRESPAAAEVLRWCGEAVQGGSWWVEARIEEGKVATTANYFFIERRNSWLIWGQTLEET